MDIEKAKQSLIEAISNVEGRFVITEGIPKTKIKKEQVERSFAYELYHQWSLIIDKYKQEHEGENLLTLNGEISKHFDSRSTFPDMILHGGQSNLEHQLIVCEIKRRDNRYPSTKSISNDLEKLDGYLRLTLPSSDGDREVHYKLAVFIMVNTTKEELKKLIIDSLHKCSKQESIKENASKILCISYNPSKDSQKGDTSPHSFTLSKII